MQEDPIMRAKDMHESATPLFCETSSETQCRRYKESLEDCPI